MRGRLPRCASTIRGGRDSAGAAARSWLFRVAELRCLKDQRSRCRRDRAYGRAATICVPNDGPVDDVYLRLADSVGRSDRVHVILASLHPSYREILETCMGAGEPTGRQLSEALGVTHLAVRVRLTRAKRAFRSTHPAQIRNASKSPAGLLRSGGN